MRKLVILLSALGGLSAPSIAWAAEPRVVLLFPEHADGPAVVIPAGSALRLLPSSLDHPNQAVFSGRMELTGTYELKGYGEDAWVTLWPDRKSLAAMPYWHDWWEGPPTEISFENGWAFAQAVVGENQLHKLKAEDHSERGTITVIVDNYDISIECDRAYYSARFVAVVDTKVQLAANAREDEEAGC